MYLKSQGSIEALHELADIVKQELLTLQKKAEEVVPIPMKLTEWPKAATYTWSKGYNYSSSFAHYESDWFKFRNYYGDMDIEAVSADQLLKRKEAISEQLDKLSQDIAKCEEENKAAIENNKLIHEKIKLMMKHIGVPDSFSTWEYPSSRSRNKKETRHSAGYLGDLTRNVPIYIPGQKPDVVRLRQQVEKGYNDALIKINAAQQAKEKAKKEKESVHELALLRAKYCPDNAQADVWEIRETILSKDKYLSLAYWLERNRGDWSDGYYFAETGLDSFTVDENNPEDVSIFNEINSLIEDWGGDGRCFRDCKWNYNVLYEKADSKLVNDLRKLREMDEDL